MAFGQQDVKLSRSRLGEVLVACHLHCGSSTTMARGKRVLVSPRHFGYDGLADRVGLSSGLIYQNQ